MTWRLLLVGLAVAALLVPLPAATVEQSYSRLVFPLLQSRLTAASNAVPVALFDLLLLGVVLPLAVMIVVDLLRPVPWPRRVLATVLRLLTTAAVVYLVFLATWGLNYRRLPLREKLPFDASRVSSAAAVELGRLMVARLNAQHAAAHAGEWTEAGRIDRRLADALDSALRALGTQAPVTPAWPKHTMLDAYFRGAGVSGMTDPFFLETLVPSTLLPFERPFVVAHEWSHLAGYTDEGEANFVAWLACLRGAPSHQYSAWLSLYGEVAAALPPEQRAAVLRPLADGPRADLSAIRARLDREISPALSAAGWKVYDQYLRANRVDAGTASYAEVVQLILATGLR